MGGLTSYGTGPDGVASPLPFGGYRCRTGPVSLGTLALRSRSRNGAALPGLSRRGEPCGEGAGCIRCMGIEPARPRSLSAVGVRSLAFGAACQRSTAARVAPGEQDKAADRRQGGALSREANAVMRARRQRPKGQGWPGAWLCQLAHPMEPHRPSLASAPSIPASLRRDHVPPAGRPLGRPRFPGRGPRLAPVILRTLAHRSRSRNGAALPSLSRRGEPCGEGAGCIRCMGIERKCR